MIAAVENIGNKSEKILRGLPRVEFDRKDCVDALLKQIIDTVDGSEKWVDFEAEYMYRGVLLVVTGQARANYRPSFGDGFETRKEYFEVNPDIVVGDWKVTTARGRNMRSNFSSCWL